MIDRLGQSEPTALVCALFGVTRSCLYTHRQRRDRIDLPRMALRSQVHQLFVDSRSSAGSRSIKDMMREQGSVIGRFKVARLMAELGLICKQPGNHAYKQATVERVDIPNRLNRQFTVEAPNRVWCGDITFVWAQGRWHYLAVVLDLFTRRIVGWAFSARPDADLVVQALDMAFEQRGRRDVSFRPGQSIWKSKTSATALALSHRAEHESPWKLLGQFADGTCLSQSEERVDTVDWLHHHRGSRPRYQLLPDATLQPDSSASI
jgi:putative transposase